MFDFVGVIKSWNFFTVFSLKNNRLQFTETETKEIRKTVAEKRNRSKLNRKTGKK